MKKCEQLQIPIALLLSICLLFLNRPWTFRLTQSVIGKCYKLSNILNEEKEKKAFSNSYCLCNHYARRIPEAALFIKETVSKSETPLRLPAPSLSCVITPLSLANPP